MTYNSNPFYDPQQTTAFPPIQQMQGQGIPPSLPAVVDHSGHCPGHCSRDRRGGDHLAAHVPRLGQRRRSSRHEHRHIDSGGDPDCPRVPGPAAIPTLAPVEEPEAAAAPTATITEIRSATHNTTSANTNSAVCGGAACDRVVIEFSGADTADVTQAGGGNGSLEFSVTADGLGKQQFVNSDNRASPNITSITTRPGGGDTVIVTVNTGGASTRTTMSTASSPFRVIIDFLR